jgi:hypothetical protein
MPGAIAATPAAHHHARTGRAGGGFALATAVAHLQWRRHGGDRRWRIARFSQCAERAAALHSGWHAGHSGGRPGDVSGGRSLRSDELSRSLHGGAVRPFPRPWPPAHPTSGHPAFTPTPGCPIPASRGRTGLNSTFARRFRSGLVEIHEPAGRCGLSRRGAGAFQRVPGRTNSPIAIVSPFHPPGFLDGCTRPCAIPWPSLTPEPIHSVRIEIPTRAIGLHRRGRNLQRPGGPGRASWATAARA